MQEVTVEQVYEFLKQHYKHDRFEGRNTETWGSDYSMTVAEGVTKQLNHGIYTLISHHESKTGEAVWFNHKLIALDNPPSRWWRSANPKDYLYGAYIHSGGCGNCGAEFTGPKHADICYECVLGS